MSIGNLDYKIFDVVDSYDYEKEVNDKVEEYKKFLLDKKPNYVLDLKIDLKKFYEGNNENEVVKKIAVDVINYKIKEKAYVKLMSEGIIYPIHICDHRAASFDYKISMVTCHTGIDVIGLIFNMFMKL